MLLGLESSILTCLLVPLPVPVRVTTCNNIFSIAPVLAITDFPEYMDVVAASIGSECNARLRSATDAMDKLLDTPAGTTQAAALFGACQSMGSDIDKTVFVSALADPVCGIVQYNNDNNKYV